jgi:N-acetylmuramoyl-L-alanine amidase-like protein
MLGGAAVCVGSGSAPAFARDDGTIARLIEQAGALEPVSGRIEFISRSLLGTRYIGNTLIGGPRKPEQFVVRADGFDCVTFCETVLAMALAHDYRTFEALLKRIRYANGDVRWDERNHYFADWTRRAVENEFCRTVELPRSVTIEKALNFGPFGRRQMALLCAPADALLRKPSGLSSGDIIAFVSRRTGLDFFHTGFVMLSPKGDVILRHASQSRGRVIDQPMDLFVAINRVQYASLLRPVDRQRA